MKFDYYIHGLWILGSVLVLIGAMFAGNIEWVPGTTTTSYAMSIILAFVLVLVGGMCWISSAANARQEEKQ